MGADTKCLAASIRDWRRDINEPMNAQKPNHPRYAMTMLCYAHNWATNPAAMYTDREHRALRRFSRWIMRRLRTMRGWHDSDSGRLYC